MFDKEKDFENALIAALHTKYGWDSNILHNPTEDDLVRNWANILYENNRTADTLGNFPLTDSEMQQIILQVNQLHNPLERNAFINAGIVTITRDNPDDTAHLGKPVTLRIFNRFHIAAAESHYQIAVQPRFHTADNMTSNRRGDFMLLINGMPVIHVELKRSGVSPKQAALQIKKYVDEGIFDRGIYSLVQVFVAMNPEETLYFSNAGESENFQDEYFFHWADADNRQINDWQGIASHLLSIPMAHQLIGSYTVADNNDNRLKVMRSYQYYAASRVCDRVRTAQWGDNDIYGGYIWHTTGSGKTLTSFKAAQLIAMSKIADKVVFLVDRIELGTQSLEEYRGFADAMDDVQDTSDTDALIAKLKSPNAQDTLIVTSIQKMSRIKPESHKEADINAINAWRMVIIIDEAHRDTFGEMMIQMRKTFKKAIYFGFTGTPVMDENNRLGHTSASIFGKLLHRYSIADGIRDRNVLPFDKYKVCVYSDDTLRKQIALEKAHADTEAEALADDNKKEVYLHFMNDVPMEGRLSTDEEKGIEDYIPSVQYRTSEYQSGVVANIVGKFAVLSRARKFHAIFATSSIPEAIQYYDRFRQAAPELRITCLVDPSIDNTDGASVKEENLARIVSDYNTMYGTTYTMPTYAAFKKDITLRLAHKKLYKHIDGTDKTLDILIVVDQMLTGYDSKWVNTLYLDKVLRYERIIQAFSRTNRLFGNQEKPHGIIKWYRKPHTMERYIEEALEIYADDKEFPLFVDHLENNLQNINQTYLNIKHIFETAGVENFITLPDDKSARAKFAKEFKELNFYIESARLQGFEWERNIYDFSGEPHRTIKMLLDKQTYEILLLRYKELFSGGGGGGGDDVPYDCDIYLIERGTGRIDTDYMNSRFTKYYRDLLQYGINGEGMTEALAQLHREFAILSQEEQHYAELFLHDVQNGSVQVDEEKTLSDYITEYMTRAKDDRIHRCSLAFGLEEQQLRDIMASQPSEQNINLFNRYDNLKETIDIEKAQQFIEQTEQQSLPSFLIMPKVDEFLRRFILQGGFDI